jgi:5-formyltetrahydrofolate cyclo-ligase
MRAAIEAIDPEEALARSRQAAANLIALPAFRDARVLMLYLTIPGEVDTAPIAHAAWQAGKTVLAPKACGVRKLMKPVVCIAHDEDLFHPHNGLRQPAGNDVVPSREIDLVIVPALAFDRRCNRLGRGGGFYDRFLADPQLRAVTVGYAFAEQIIGNVPMHENDLPVDIVVTDRNVFGQMQAEARLP